MPGDASIAADTAAATRTPRSSRRAEGIAIRGTRDYFSMLTALAIAGAQAFEQFGVLDVLYHLPVICGPIRDLVAGHVDTLHLDHGRRLLYHRGVGLLRLGCGVALRAELRVAVDLHDDRLLIPHRDPVAHFQILETRDGRIEVNVLEDVPLGAERNDPLRLLDPIDCHPDCHLLGGGVLRAGRRRSATQRGNREDSEQQLRHGHLCRQSSIVNVPTVNLQSSMLQS
jgi:hypothetical protein